MLTNKFLLVFCAYLYLCSLLREPVWPILLPVKGGLISESMYQRLYLKSCQVNLFPFVLDRSYFRWLNLLTRQPIKRMDLEFGFISLKNKLQQEKTALLGSSCSIVNIAH